MIDHTDPDALRAVADLAEQSGGCSEGVEWGRSHVLADVDHAMLPEHAGWVLAHLGRDMTPECADHFVAAACRHISAATAAHWSASGLTASQYARLAAVASANPRFVEIVGKHEPGFRGRSR